MAYDDDATFARALQEEYEKEYRRRSMQQHLGGVGYSASEISAPLESARPTAPMADGVFDKPFYVAPTAAAEPDYSVHESAHGGVEMSDEEYARIVEREMMEEAMETQRKFRKQQLQQQRDSFRANRVSGATGTTINSRLSQSQMITSSRLNPRSNLPSSQRNLAVSTNYNSSINQNSHYYNSRSMAPAPSFTGKKVLSDEEFAARLEQEMIDEALARQAHAEEQGRNTSATRATANASSNSRKCGFRRCCSCAVTLLIVAAAVIVALYLTGNQTIQSIIPGKFNPANFLPNLGADPFSNISAANLNRWKTSGGRGLQLTVINALDPVWSPYFDKAVQQWDAGYPDALTLFNETASPDSVCTPVNGKLKVCNGNYGATDWRGINKVLLQNGWIYASAARMNDYYTSNNDGSQRQYTMCHEVRTVGIDMNGLSSFQACSPCLLATYVYSLQIGHGFGLPHTDENFYNKDLGNCLDYTLHPEVNMQPAFMNYKLLAQLYGTLDGSPIPNGTRALENDYSLLGRELDGSLPPRVAAAMEEVDRLIDSGKFGSEMDGWRMLFQSQHGCAHVIDLGGGHTIQIHVLA